MKYQQVDQRKTSHSTLKQRREASRISSNRSIDQQNDEDSVLFKQIKEYVKANQKRSFKNPKTNNLEEFFTLNKRQVKLPYKEHIQIVDY